MGSAAPLGIRKAFPSILHCAQQIFQSPKGESRKPSLQRCREPRGTFRCRWPQVHHFALRKMLRSTRTFLTWTQRPRQETNLLSLMTQTDQPFHQARRHGRHVLLTVQLPRSSCMLFFSGMFSTILKIVLWLDFLLCKMKKVSRRLTGLWQRFIFVDKVRHQLKR